ncbi:MAG: cation diffusion facilitator family transporter [Acidimicrobiales bacterium]
MSSPGPDADQPKAGSHRDHGDPSDRGDGHRHGGHGSDHGHSHGVSLARAGARHVKRLTAAFAIIAVFFVVEAVAGVLTNSLALLSDAGHMLTDVIGLGMALAAIQLASRFASRTTGLSSHTFGLYRLEILAAFVNALLLFGVAIWVLVEAVRRLGSAPEVLAGPMFVVAVLGLLANIVAFWLLRDGSQESINIEAAYLEVLADLIGSVGVIIGAILLRFFGWTWVDPVIGALIGLWILPRTWRLGRNAVRILLQAAPAHIELDRLHRELEHIDGVSDVHDLHVWTLTSEMEAASAHLVTTEGTDPHGVLDQARALLQTDYGIEHGTFQIEPDTHVGCHDVTW